MGFCSDFYHFWKCNAIRDVGRGEEGTGVKWDSHPNRITNIMLSDLLDLPLFWFSLFDAFKTVIRYFQFYLSILLMFFSLAIHPQQPLQDWNIQYMLVGLPTKVNARQSFLLQMKLILFSVLGWFTLVRPNRQLFPRNHYLLTSINFDECFHSRSTDRGKYASERLRTVAAAYGCNILQLYE